MTDASFPGFPGAQAFLADLAAHNDRDWFTAHKAAYEEAIRGPAEAFVACVEPALGGIAAGPVGGRIFRVHRDVRFSKDKRPYNAHLHISFGGPRGLRGEPPASGFYFGLEPDKLMIGAGGFEYSGATLDAFRAAVADPTRGAALEELLARLRTAGFRIDGAQLKRVPAPYPADHPRADLLRHKGLSAWRDVSDPALVAGPGVLAETLEVFAALEPLVRWLAAL